MVTKPSDGGLEVHPGNQAIPGRPEGWKGFQMAVQDLVARLRAQAPEPAPVPVPDPEPEEPLRGDQKMPEAWKVADFLEEHARMWQAVAGIISGYADDLEASEMFPKTIAANLALQELRELQEVIMKRSGDWSLCRIAIHRQINGGPKHY